MQFFKYQGTGNDFVLIDNRNDVFDRSNTDVVKQLCDRRFGIGADGLMLLQSKTDYDFEMVYYNADGNESSMCGNGGRCIVEFARFLGLVTDTAHFYAIDGAHEAKVAPGFINLKMKDVSEIELNETFSFLNTGSPHYVQFVDNVETYNVQQEGAKIRNSDRFKPKGTNVNFIQQCKDELFVRTFERGVEGETYSCGTGVTAAAIVANIKAGGGDVTTHIKTLGGKLTVRFRNTNNTHFSNIWLEGPATFVFQGQVAY
jgi:diaminopimelate epimerase